MLFETEVVACFCHSPLHHQKPDFEGQSVIKASSYLLPFVLEAHRESLLRFCEPLLADSPPSLLKFTAQQISLLALHTSPSQVMSLDIYLRAADITVCVRVTSSSGLQTASSVLQQFFNCNFNIYSLGQELKIFRSRSTRSTDIDHLYAPSRGYEGR